MKKDLDWLNNELEKVIKDVESDDISFAGKKDYDEGYIDGIRDVQSIVNQLNEPETVEETTRLLENVLKENKRLGKLLEEKHEEWLELMDEINNQETLSAYWMEQKSIDTHVDTLSGEVQMTFRLDDLENLLVPKQELPVIPKFVADWIEENKKKNRSLVFAIKHIYDENEIGKSPKLYIWMETDDNEEVFARAWLDGFMVEEQKYIVSDNSSIPLLIKNDSGEVMSYDSQIAYNNSNGTIELTEQEIKDYDERYMAFAKPVVVCN